MNLLNDLTVGFASAEDVASVVELANKLAEHDTELDSMITPSPSASEQLKARISIDVVTPGRYVGVARLDGRVVGMATGNLSRSDVAGVTAANLQMLFVDAEARRHGAGTSLVNHFSDWGREKGAIMISVMTYLNNNDEVIGFYRGKEFEPTMLELRKKLN